MLNEQAKVADNEDPKLLSNDILDKMDELKREVNYLVSKIKYFKPKTKKPTTTATDDKKSNKTTSNSSSSDTNSDAGEQESKNSESQSGSNNGQEEEKPFDENIFDKKEDAEQQEPQGETETDKGKKS
jgi:hypothetical protein